MNRTVLLELCSWVTPNTLRKTAPFINIEELTALWPILVKRMIEYALSTNLKGNDLRSFLRREGYVPYSLPWTSVRYYWWLWCKEAEVSWKQLWAQAWPINFFCNNCCWNYFQHNDDMCEYCVDRELHCKYLPCRCGFQGTPSILGIILCHDHTKKITNHKKTTLS